MSMRTIKFTVHWDPAEAYTVIEFLDQLRDSLCAQYAKEIRLMLQDAQCHQNQGDAHLQMTLPFNDQIPF
jgi:hypothetical protein